MKRKTIIKCFLVVFCIGFVSCTTTATLYKSKMVSMKIEDKNDVKTVGTDTLCYQDSIMQLCIRLDEDLKYLIIEVSNLQEYKIKILWDEAVILVNGNSSSVIHEGTKFIDKNAPQLPSVIIGKTNFVEYICPSDNVYWAKGSQYSSGYWAISPIINKKSDNQSIVVSIPIEYQDKKITYTSELITTEAGTAKVPNVMGTTFVITGGIIGVLVGIIFILF